MPQGRLGMASADDLWRTLPRIFVVLYDGLHYITGVLFMEIFSQSIASSSIRNILRWELMSISRNNFLIPF